MKEHVDGSVHDAVSGDLDLLIIGAGASGVGCGVMAGMFGVDPSKTLIVERGGAVGSTFDKWPAEMRFITPSFNQQAFGMMDLNSVAFDTGPAQMFHTQHPSGQQYARYLRIVAHMHNLPIVLETDVTAVTPISQCRDSGHEHGGDDGFEVRVAQSAEATHKLPPKLRARFVIWAAGEFQYPRTDGFPGASENCVHNSCITSWEKLAKTSDEMVVIGGYESGIDATVHLANAGCDVTVLASTPFWSMRTLDPSTELAPFTVNRLQSALGGAHPPTLMSHCRVVNVEKDGHDGGYVITAEKTNKALLNAETLSLQVRRSSSSGFGVFLQTSTVVKVETVEAGGPADQSGFKSGDVVVELAGVQVEGAPHGLTEAMERIKSLSAKGREVFEWKLRRAHEADDDDEKSHTTAQADDSKTVRVKTKSKPVLATGFNSGVGKVVNHLFDWTEESLCASGDDAAADVGHDDTAAEEEEAEEAEEAVAGVLTSILDKVQLRKEPSEAAPIGDAKLTKCDESTICPGLFLCGPQVRQDNEIFCFVYKYRQRFAVVMNEIAKRLKVPETETEKAVEECRKRNMFLDDVSCCKATCGAGSC
jgi:hypothetical protein